MEILSFHGTSAKRKTTFEPIGKRKKKIQKILPATAGLPAEVLTKSEALASVTKSLSKK
ncbi:MAG: hypothetical protein JSV83_22430 [Desulfobacterales bacterium]|nr:MAG: hypothetical protein JSV83_22430 [Desulfobacterales bacterium]